MKYIILILAALLFLLGCGDTNIYNLELGECSCIQLDRDAKVFCKDFQIEFKGAKCTVRIRHEDE